MKTINKYSFFIFFTFILLFLFPSKVTASETGYISDEASLFTEEQISSINLHCQEIKDTYAIDTIILTRNKIAGNRKQYIENYFDDADEELTDAVIMLINMDSKK